MNDKGMDNQFSSRQIDVIYLLMQGKSNKEIAKQLNISVRTVEAHLGSIYAKLGVTSRTEAILKLSQNEMWKSTIENFRDDTGSPQFKNNENLSIILSKIKRFFHSLQLPRIGTKTLLRTLIII